MQKRKHMDHQIPTSGGGGDASLQVQKAPELMCDSCFPVSKEGCHPAWMGTARVAGARAQLEPLWERWTAAVGAYTYSWIPLPLPRRDSGAAPPHQISPPASPPAAGCLLEGGPEREPPRGSGPPRAEPLCPCRCRPLGTGSAPLLLPAAGGGQPAPPLLSPPLPPRPGRLAGREGWGPAVQRPRVFWQQGRAPRRRVAGS